MVFRHSFLGQRQVLEHILAHAKLWVILCPKIALMIANMLIRCTRTLFQFLQHRGLKVNRGTLFEEQPLSKRSVVKRPKDVLIVRIPVQSQHRIEKGLKFRIG